MAEVFDYNKQSNTILYNYLVSNSFAGRSVVVLNNMFECTMQEMPEIINSIDVNMHIDCSDSNRFFLTCALQPSFTKENGYYNLKKPLSISDRIFLQDGNIVYFDRYNAIDFKDHIVVISAGKDDLSTSKVQIDKYFPASEIELFFTINSFLNFCSVVISDLLEVKPPRFSVNPSVLMSLKSGMPIVKDSSSVRIPPALVRVLEEDIIKIEPVISGYKNLEQDKDSNKPGKVPQKAVDNPGIKINKKPAALQKVIQNV